MSQGMDKIGYVSAYSTRDHNAGAIRRDYFVRELGRSCTVDMLVPKWGSINNKHSFLLRLLMEMVIGLDLSLQCFFSRRRLFVLSSPPFVTNVMVGMSLVLMGRRYILDIRDPWPEAIF